MATSIEESVLDLLRKRSPLARRLAAETGLPADLPLGAGGLGLDSIALAELLLDLEQRFGVPAADELLAGPPLTVGRVIAHLRAAVPGATGGPAGTAAVRDLADDPTASAAVGAGRAPASSPRER